MLIEEHMGFRRVVCFITFILLLVAAVAEGKKRILFSGNLIESSWGELNEETAETLWFNKYLHPQYPLFPRRRELLQSLAGSPAPSPAIGSPAPCPAVGSPAFSPIPSSPSPSRSLVPNSQPLFPPIDDSSLQPKAGGDSSGSPASAANVESKDKNAHKAVVIAVVTASVTLFVVVLVFLCYRRIHSEDFEATLRWQVMLTKDGNTSKVSLCTSKMIMEERKPRKNIYSRGFVSPHKKI